MTAAMPTTNSKKNDSDFGYGKCKCPKCGGCALTGEPLKNTRFRGSAKCVNCEETFSAIGMEKTDCSTADALKIARDAMSEAIERKISEGTVTIDDFNRLIAEAMPECTRDRIRRRTTINPEADHLNDKTGDQPLSPIPRRPTPKRKSLHSQHHGRGRQALKRSGATAISKFSEATKFILTHQGKPFDLTLVENKENLYKVVTRLMVEPGVNRDWLDQVRRELELTNGR